MIIRINLWQPTFLAFFRASRQWLFSPTLPKIMRQVQTFSASSDFCMFVLKSLSLAKPPGIAVQSARSLSLGRVVREARGKGVDLVEQEGDIYETSSES
jgi:hypothetical protein